MAAKGRQSAAVRGRRGEARVFPAKSAVPVAFWPVQCSWGTFRGKGGGFRSLASLGAVLRRGGYGGRRYDAGKLLRRQGSRG
ncbi:hypothetical protein E2562_017113 [Oryza meyeriana var. granulata]|uniref:Uncharacterized protein n=1 Tax=Oryza meyeriana var. granulata TaxID=110450 RepID=A0A6G1DXH5_9ORYZ|nr:hypothetical protein E2562_017113 [Oryza meyeriana var. granulata]